MRLATLMPASEFQRELTRERIRSTRRSYPFCVLYLSLHASGDAKRQRKWRRQVTAILNRYTRLTDYKAHLRRDEFAVLFTDTPEMGGRSATDRLIGMLSDRNIRADVRLSVCDADGFGNPPGDAPEDTDGSDDRSDHLLSRRRADSPILAEPTFLESASMHPDGDESLQACHGGVATAVTAQSVAPTGVTIQPRGVTAGLAVGHGHVEFDAAPWGDRQKSLGSFLKRSVDVVGAGTGLLLCSPLLAGAMLAIRLSDGGSPVFRQVREGRGGRPFTIYKLRTMVVDAEKRQAELRELSHRDGPAFKISRDPRVTPIGHWLRKTCLDELPQLYNVLWGDMSLVGPRPLPWHESRACSRWQRRRLDVRPGLTCYWQINKARAETFDDWMRLDLKYLRKRCFTEDLKLILMTFTVPLTGRGSD